LTELEGGLGAPLVSFLDPGSIAVVGASASGRGVGATTLATIRRFGYGGRVVAVNGSTADIDGISSFPSLRDIPHPDDLVLVLCAAERVRSVIEDAVTIGASGAVIFASGFSETGAAGRRLQGELVEIARRSGLRLLGPNCQGVVSLSAHLAATFSNALRTDRVVAAAPLAYIGQSGAIGGTVFDLGRERGCAPSFWVSTGNQADLDVVEVAAQLLDVVSLEVLMLYLEQVPDGGRWQALCSGAATAGKRLVVLRTGTSEVGRVAVASHTGALVAGERAFEAVSERHGVLLAHDVNEMLHLAMLHVAGSGRGGMRIGVVTTSGGAGGLAADLLERAGLGVPSLSDATCARLGEQLSALATAQNPLDVTADLVVNEPGRLGAVCASMAADASVEQLLIILSVVVGHTAMAVAESLCHLRRQAGLPISVVYLASHDRTIEVRAALADAGVPVFDSLTTAVDALARVTRAVPRPRTLTAPVRGAALDIVVVTEAAGAPYLRAVGVPVPDGVLVCTRLDAERAGASLGAELVLKVQSPQVPHKTDVGAVRVGVSSGAAGAVFDELLADMATRAPHAQIDGVLVQRRAPGGVELLVSARPQPGGFPLLVSCGLGGAAAELYGDVVSDTLPIDEQHALHMLEQLRGWPLLAGFRGRPHADVAAAVKVIVAMGPVCDLLGDTLIEVEINPLIVHPRGHGATAADFIAFMQGPPSSLEHDLATS